MEAILVFFQQYGLVISLIALGGIIILGFLKYCNVFKKLNETARHYCYLGISIGISIIATVIYLAIVKQLNISFVSMIALAIISLNQTFYAIFKITPINKLFEKILDFIKCLIASKAIPDAKNKENKK